MLSRSQMGTLDSNVHHQSGMQNRSVRYAATGSHSKMVKRTNAGWVLTEMCHAMLCVCALRYQQLTGVVLAAPAILSKRLHRDEANRKALLAAIKSGDIDIISSDHSPAPADLKEAESGDFLKAWGGISGQWMECSVYLRLWSLCQTSQLLIVLANCCCDTTLTRRACN